MFLFRFTKLCHSVKKRNMSVIYDSQLIERGPKRRCQSHACGRHSQAERNGEVRRLKRFSISELLQDPLLFVVVALGDAKAEVMF